MAAMNFQSEAPGFKMCVSEQPLIRITNNRNNLEATNNPNGTQSTENAKGITDGALDNSNSGKSPTEFLPDDENYSGPTIKNKTGIINNILGGSDDDALTAFSLYRNKKLLTQSMMDIALFTSNANQLRNVLEANDGQAISIICITLLLFSIILQIVVGVLLLLSTQFNVTSCEERKVAFKYGNYVIIGIFLTTVVNILILAFGGPSGTGN